MADLSKVDYKGTEYNLKDATARQKLIPNDTNSNVAAIVDFLNGLKVAGNPVISTITATATSVEADQPVQIEVTVSATGEAEMEFKIPKAQVVYSSYFIEDALLFTDGDYTSFTSTGIIIGV